MLFFLPTLSPFPSLGRMVSWKTVKPLVQVFGCIVLTVVLFTGCSPKQSGQETEYHAGTATPGSGGATIKSSGHQSTVFVGQPDGGGKTEGGGFVAYHGALAVLAQRLGAGPGN